MIRLIVRPLLALSVVAFAFCGSAASAAEGGEAVAELPLTIMPYQVATFVGDRAAAAELAGFAEFSARLLYWTDTPREPVILGGQVVKATLAPFVDEWRRGSGSRPGAASAMVRARIADAYRELSSPRLLRITLKPGFSVEAPERLDALAGATLDVPCLVDNQRAETAVVAVSAPGAQAPLDRLEVAPGEVRGVFLRVSAPPGATEVTVAVAAGAESRELRLPVRTHTVGRVRVRVLDPEGEPTPARVYLRGADGRAHAPAGTLHRIVAGGYGQPGGGEPYFFTNGVFELPMPAGPVQLEVVKGFEYLPVRVEAPIDPATPFDRTIRLQRRDWVKRDGWHSADSHVHANLFAQTLIAPADVLTIAKAEDLNVVNLLPCNDPRTTIINDRQHFTGGPHAVSEPGTILYFSEEMRNDLYGHVGFLGLREFVEPAYFGWPNSPFPHDVPGNHPQGLAARAQGAAVTYVHPSLPSAFPVDIALGAADTLDVMSQNLEEPATQWWYQLLNCGFRCPASAGPDSFLNIPMHLLPGACRVYVQIEGKLTFDAWLDAFKRGRSYVTNGPLLRFAVEGAAPGDVLHSPGPRTVRVQGAAESNVPMESIELIVNGETVRRIPVASDGLSVAFDETLTLVRSGWVAARVRGPAHRLVTADREVYAHTSPVYVTIGGRPTASRAAAHFFIAQIDALIEKVRSRGSFAHPSQCEQIVRHFRRAQDVYHRIAAEDFSGRTSPTE